ncbi:glutathione hydrolase 7-like [Neolamprologus brichardi]|uniref:glutathione hydrolase 7-like n=1 Tax=Neolamprologus brichardi TaxID=32507 RepID=UPI001643F901|nr:glutathione hydrolase 7-like [Neolamprologus brichardi]
MTQAKVLAERHHVSRNAIQRQNRVRQGVQHHSYHLQQPGYPFHLKQLAPNGTNLFHQSPSNQEADEDCSSRGTPITVYALSTIFAIGVSIALVLQIYLGESLVCNADAISKVSGEQQSQSFNNTFMPHGRPLSAGSYVRLPRLAGVLEAGLLNFYHGNLSQEIVDEAQANGGVLSREDIGNYSVDVEIPIEAQYNDKEFIIQVPPPPSAGAVLLSALNLLEGLHISKSNVTETQTRLWIAEALKTALAMASGLGDPNYNSSVTEALSNMLSKSQAEVFGQQLNYSHTSPSEYLSPIHSTQTELVAGQVTVMGQDKLIVSVASSLSRPFGSRLVTRSGIVLNSLILDFSWPNTSREQLQINQENCVEPGKRPLSLLMPIIVVPALHKCGIHVAVSTSGEQNALSVITQMLVNLLFFHTEKNDSFSLTGLHHQFEPNKLLVHSHFQGDSGQSFHAKAHAVQRVRTEESY